MTLRTEYISAITKETEHRQKILETINDYCRTLTETERIIIKAKLIDGISTKKIRSMLTRLNISINHKDLQRLTKVILQPLAVELGIRIENESDGNAVEIIAAGRKKYEIRQAEKGAAKRAERTERHKKEGSLNLNQKVAIPDREGLKVLPTPPFRDDPGGSRPKT